MNPDHPRRSFRGPRPAVCALLVVACAASASAPAFAQAAAQIGSESYRLEKVVATRSGNTGWDYNSLDDKRGHMFIAHRKDGLMVYDVRKGRVVKMLRDSKNANTSALAPEFDIGISGTTDGDVVVFKLSTLQTLKRYKSGTGGFDGATYDPTTRRFALVGEADTDKHATPVLFFDGKTGEPAGSVDVPSEKVDAPRPDASGRIYLPLRDKAAVARIDILGKTVDANWPLTDCFTPASLEVDAANQRVFVACRGKVSSAPALAVLDTVSGRQLAKVPIGRNTDDVFYDKARKTIITVNGEDASMTFITQKSADDYRLAQSVSTRPTARTGVFDETTGKIHLVTAESVNVYDDAGKPVTTFLPNTFVVLTYGRARLPAGDAED